MKPWVEDDTEGSVWGGLEVRRNKEGLALWLPLSSRCEMMRAWMRAKAVRMERV